VKNSLFREIPWSPIIISVEEGCYVFTSVCLSVCLFVCPSDNWKSCERILTKFLAGVGHDPGTKRLNFGDDPDHRPDPEVRSPKSGFTGLSKNYLVDSDQSCIANFHCKNHSAILLCWRSAEVSAPWVILVFREFLTNLLLFTKIFSLPVFGNDILPIYFLTVAINSCSFMMLSVIIATHLHMTVCHMQSSFIFIFVFLIMYVAIESFLTKNPTKR